MGRHSQNRRSSSERLGQDVEKGYGETQSCEAKSGPAVSVKGDEGQSLCLVRGRE